MVIYNENDAYASRWLRNLSDGGHIARGRVDDRSISDLRPEDVRGAAQFHAFAGIGGWSLALRLAGWPDDREVWSGSCPCQPWSAAGKGKGHGDERHLWPEWYRLIRACRPPVVFGEQVASASVIGRARGEDRGGSQEGDGGVWLDLVSSDLEREGYAVGAAVVSAAGVGAPHIRQRLYFVAVAEREPVRGGGRGEVEREAGGVQEANGQRQRVRDDVGECGDVGVAVADGVGEREPGDEALRETGARGVAGRGGDAVVGIADGRRQQGSGLFVWRSGFDEGEGVSATSWTGEDGLGDASRDGERQQRFARASARQQQPIGGYGLFGDVADASLGRRDEERAYRERRGGGRGGEPPRRQAGERSHDGRLLGDDDDEGLPIGPRGADGRGTVRAEGSPAPAAGPWGDCEWVPCRDKERGVVYRPVESGAFPLAPGLPKGVGRVEPGVDRLAEVASLKRAKQCRVGRLRGYGNAIAPECAAAFIRAVLATGLLG